MENPEAMTLGQIKEELDKEMKGEVELQTLDVASALKALHAWRLMVEADYKGGKSYMIASAMKYVAERYTPEQCRWWVIDNDGDGIVPLLSTMLDPKYATRSTLHVVITATDEERLAIREANKALDQAIKDIKAHIAAGNPPEACWIFIDNMKEIWQSAQDFFSRTVYGTPLTERLLAKRQQAARDGKKSAPTFVQMSDYAFINRDHDFYIANKLRDSGINYIWTAPLTEYDEEVRDGQVKTKVIKAEGKKDLHAKVDWIVRIRYKGDGPRLASLYGSRWLRARFDNVDAVDFPKFIEIVRQLVVKEKELGLRPKDNNPPLPFLGGDNGNPALPSVVNPPNVAVPAATDSKPSVEPSPVEAKEEPVPVKPAEEPKPKKGGPWDEL